MTEIYGYAFHYALRRGLDSKASSICWNAINLTTEEQWAQFIKEVNTKDGTLAERCRSIHLYGKSALNLLMIGLELLTDAEYEVLEKYCQEFADEVDEYDN